MPPRDVAAVIGLSGHTPEQQQPRIAPASAPPPAIDRMHKLTAILANAVAMKEQPTSLYLAGRGLEWDCIKGMGNLYFVGIIAVLGNAEQWPACLFGHYPAMVAAMLSMMVVSRALHTYIQEHDYGVWRKIENSAQRQGGVTGQNADTARWRAKRRGHSTV